MEKYSYEQELGVGGYGSVWRCTEADTGQVVAVKRFKDAHLDEEVMRLAMREVRLLRLAKHRNIVKLLEAFRSKSGRVYLVMEYVERTLTTDLKNNPQGLPLAQVKLFMWQLCQAVRYMHHIKVLHRDIKPANILVSSSGVVKLCDFGFARTLHPRATSDYSSYVVTRWYRPPEVLVGDRYGPPLDIWGLGCIFVELATGRALLPGKSNLDQLDLTLRLLGTLSPQQMQLIQGDAELSTVHMPRPGSVPSFHRKFSSFTSEMLQLVTACLQADPDERLTAEQLLALPYFNDIYALMPQLSSMNPAAYGPGEDVYFATLEEREQVQEAAIALTRRTATTVPVATTSKAIPKTPVKPLPAVQPSAASAADHHASAGSGTMLPPVPLVPPIVPPYPPQYAATGQPGARSIGDGSGDHHSAQALRLGRTASLPAGGGAYAWNHWAPPVPGSLSEGFANGGGAPLSRETSSSTTGGGGGGITSCPRNPHAPAHHGIARSSSNASAWSFGSAASVYSVSTHDPGVAALGGFHDDHGDYHSRHRFTRSSLSSSSQPTASFSGGGSHMGQLPDFVHDLDTAAGGANGASAEAARTMRRRNQVVFTGEPPPPLHNSPLDRPRHSLDVPPSLAVGALAATSHRLRTASGTAMPGAARSAEAVARFVQMECPAEDDGEAASPRGGAAGGGNGGGGIGGVTVDGGVRLHYPAGGVSCTSDSVAQVNTRDLSPLRANSSCEVSGVHLEEERLGGGANLQQSYRHRLVRRSFTSGRGMGRHGNMLQSISESYTVQGQQKSSAQTHAAAEPEIVPCSMLQSAISGPAVLQTLAAAKALADRVEQEGQQEGQHTTSPRGAVAATAGGTQRDRHVGDGGAGGKQQQLGGGKTEEVAGGGTPRGGALAAGAGRPPTGLEGRKSSFNKAVKTLAVNLEKMMVQPFRTSRTRVCTEDARSPSSSVAGDSDRGENGGVP